MFMDLDNVEETIGEHKEKLLRYKNIIRESVERQNALKLRVEAFTHDATLREQVAVKETTQLEEIYKEAESIQMK